MTGVSNFDPDAIARRLIAAHEGAALVPHADALPLYERGAYAVQDATVAGLGPVAGWKVGAKGSSAPPSCAPLPARGVFASGARLVGPRWRMRGIEVEVAVRLRKDLVALSGEPDAEMVRDAIDAVLPVMEVLETRLADWRDSPPLARLADLGLHGGLVIGQASTINPADLDLRTLQAYLAFDGQPVASARGANPAGDVWRLIGWLAWHCAQRGQPLRAGQVITTGSCTGLLFAPEGSHVQAQINGVGMVELYF